MAAYDRIWYWNGGAESGEWKTAIHPCPDQNTPAARTAEKAVIDDLTRMGYVAHLGTKSIGAPDGPPSIKELRRVWQDMERGKIVEHSGSVVRVRCPHCDYQTGFTAVASNSLVHCGNCREEYQIEGTR